MRTVSHGGIVAFLACLLAFGGCEKKGDPTLAAKKFFALLAGGNTAQAYAGAAFGFQAQQTEKAFVQTVREMGLVEQESVACDLPEITDDQAKVRVEVTGKSGRKMALVVTLVHESGAWRVHSLRTPAGAGGTRTENRFTLVGKGAAFSDAQSQPLPDEKEIRELVLRTLASFDQAVQQKSFADFYRDTATAWQKQLTVGQLERAFAPFIKAGVRIGGLRDAELQLDGPPAINSEGVLVVNGHLNTAPYRVFFSMKFVYELPRWKLFGLDVNLQQ